MKKLNTKNIANAVGVATHSDPQTNKTTKFNCRGGRLCPPANKQNGITLIALIITIVLNCSYLAMVVGERKSNKNRIIEKRRNLLYNRLCN